MRILLYIEPMIVWKQPKALLGHFGWARLIKFALGEDVDLHLLSNPALCQEWKQQDLGSYSEIDPFEILKIHGWDRRLYMRALYKYPYRSSNQVVPPSSAISRTSRDYLLASIRNAVEGFRPHLAIATSQSSAFEGATCGVPKLFIEQAPLPRYQQQFRTGFDPSGHQVNALVSRYYAQVSGLKLKGQTEAALQQCIFDWKRSVLSSKVYANALREVERLRGDKKVVLLATQPPDWVTFEGAYKSAALSDLICEWNEQIPEGWIGMPTFHAHEWDRLPAQLLDAIASSRSKIRLLPPEMSFNSSEVLLPAVDAIASISSTTAITAILLEKPAVTMGLAPFRPWGPSSLSELEKAKPISLRHVVRLFAAISHRVNRTAPQIERDPEWLKRLLKNRVELNNFARWQLDLSSPNVAEMVEQLAPIPS